VLEKFHELKNNLIGNGGGEYVKDIEKRNNSVIKIIEEMEQVNLKMEKNKQKS
jgi:hypothetical protein